MAPDFGCCDIERRLADHLAGFVIPEGFVPQSNNDVLGDERIELAGVRCGARRGDEPLVPESHEVAG